MDYILNSKILTFQVQQRMLLKLVHLKLKDYLLETKRSQIKRAIFYNLKS